MWTVMSWPDAQLRENWKPGRHNCITNSRTSEQYPIRWSNFIIMCTYTRVCVCFGYQYKFWFPDKSLLLDFFFCIKFLLFIEWVCVCLWLFTWISDQWNKCKICDPKNRVQNVIRCRFTLYFIPVLHLRDWSRTFAFYDYRQRPHFIEGNRIDISRQIRVIGEQKHKYTERSSTQNTPIHSPLCGQRTSESNTQIFNNKTIKRKSEKKDSTEQTVCAL